MSTVKSLNYADTEGWILLASMEWITFLNQTIPIKIVQQLCSISYITFFNICNFPWLLNPLAIIVANDGDNKCQRDSFGETKDSYEIVIFEEPNFWK
jgi:hypothetical protein